MLTEALPKTRVYKAFNTIGTGSNMRTEHRRNQSNHPGPRYMPNISCTLAAGLTVLCPRHPVFESSAVDLLRRDFVPHRRQSPRSRRRVHARWQAAHHALRRCEGVLASAVSALSLPDAGLSKTARGQRTHCLHTDGLCQ